MKFDLSDYKRHIKQTFILALPVSIGQLGHMLMGVIDSLMLGRLGAAPLAASSISNGLFFIIFVLGLGVTFAISPLVAITIGEDKKHESGDILKQGFFLNLLIAFFLFLILFFGADLIYKMNQPKLVADLSVSYLKILSFSVFPLMLFQTYRQFIEGLSIMRPAMIITLVANVVNAFGNWVLIFGNLGMPKLGIIGAGYSTTITRTFMAVVLIYYIYKSGYYNEYGINLFNYKFDAITMKRILKLGLPSGFQYFFEVGAFSSAAIIVGWIGTKQLAAHQIALNLASITYMMITGIAAAAAIRVGNAVGRKNRTEVRKAGFSAILMGATAMAIFGISFIILRYFLPELYIDDKSVIAISASLLIIAAVFQISDGVQAIGLGILRGVTDVKIPTFITFFAYWILGLPIGYFLAFNMKFGVQGVWIGFIIGLTASAIMLTLRFNRITK